MSTFSCPVVCVQIEAHPNADAIEVAVIDGYRCVVKKGQFKSGDLAVYLPEQSMMPEWLLKKLGFWDDLNNRGTLNGAAGNRIKAIKLRGVLSQGVLLSGEQHLVDGKPVVTIQAPNLNPKEPASGVTVYGNVNWKTNVVFFEGGDAASHLSVTKYEPIVPAHMAGRVAGGDFDATISYDFDNIKKMPDLFDDSELVVITEKIHGTCFQVGLIPKAVYEGKSWASKMPSVSIDGDEFKCTVTSKGQGAKGLLLDPSDASNLYVKTAIKNDIWSRMSVMRQEYGVPANKPTFLFGEVYGPGVQDGFAYGNKSEETSLRLFDMRIGGREDGFYIDHFNFMNALKAAGLESVPVLYVGAYDPEILASYTDGDTTIGGIKQMREGVVIKAASVISHPRHGRKIAKSVSEKYLLRKGAQTEFS